jgi:S-adenosylmethionine:tRNA ribosyltransferase-isomerase
MNTAMNTLTPSRLPESRLPESRLDFNLPKALEAHEPPEASGRTRSDVKLMVSLPGVDPIHTRFDQLPTALRRGDLLVVNTSGTMASAVDGTIAGRAVVLHFSTELPGGFWLVELRQPTAVRTTIPFTPDATGTTVTLPGAASVILLSRFADSQRLYIAKLQLPVRLDLPTYLAANGRPIRYAYVEHDWPIEMYQTVFATEPGSAEMPSAARPFTSDLVTSLIARGIDIAPITLHTGVSSGEVHEAPYPERFTVSAQTAARINATRATGGRVIAIGTTVVRALETVVDDERVVHPGTGWTDIVISPISLGGAGIKSVDGLLTGWHEPQASHLLMLEAIADIETLRAAYTEALAGGYRWHEFGDLHLILTR